MSPAASSSAAKSSGPAPIPIVGTYLMFFIFGGEFPGNDFISRLYTFHVLLMPGILLALIVRQVEAYLLRWQPRFFAPTDHLD